MPNLDQPYLIARVDVSRVGIPSHWATEMIVCPEITVLPVAPDYVRGIAMRRGHTVTVVDARARLGYVSRAEETKSLVALLEAREADHVHWLDTLLACVRDAKPFTMARDPHACAFGKWFDSYVPPTLSLQQQFAKFTEPHARIHELAAHAEALALKEGVEAAMALIESARTTTLARMRTLFAETRQLIMDEVREIVIVHEAEGRYVGLVVDEIEAVERLREDTLESLVGRIPGADDSLIQWSARTSHDAVVLLPELDVLMGQVGSIRV